MSSAVTKVKTTVKQTIKKITKNAETKAKKQYEKKAHTEKGGESRSPKQMTKDAKKEQKKALKEIKTTIQKTGSRLAAAGTAAASRQQSKKSHTEKVGESRNPKRMTDGAKEIQEKNVPRDMYLDSASVVINTTSNLADSATAGGVFSGISAAMDYKSITKKGESKGSAIDKTLTHFVIGAAIGFIGASTLPAALIAGAGAVVATKAFDNAYDRYINRWNQSAQQRAEKAYSRKNIKRKKRSRR